MKSASGLFITFVALLITAQATWAFNDFDPSIYEEPDGLSFSVQFNPDDNVYGFAGEQAIRLTGTPVVGQMFMTMFWMDKVSSMYGGFGMMLRLMPQWRIAPFAGAGFSYNLAFGGSGERDDGTRISARHYWGGHLEAGVRILNEQRTNFIELFGRQTYNGTDDYLDYWSAGIGLGHRW